MEEHTRDRLFRPVFSIVEIGALRGELFGAGVGGRQCNVQQPDAAAPQRHAPGNHRQDRWHHDTNCDDGRMHQANRKHRLG